MQWPPWPFAPTDATKTSERPRASQRPPAIEGSWSSPQLPNSWSYYTQPSVVIATTIMTSTIFVGRRLYVLYLRRIPGATSISSSFWRKRSLLGYVTSVGDGDGFRLFHTPGGRLAGWGWLPGRKIPAGRKLKDQTISIRLAGVDAPETAHFGRPTQPGGVEAHDWLTKYVGHRRVRARVLKRDQYDRAVARVHIWRGLLRRDVGLEMLKRGLATVYEAKSGAEFDGEKVESKYRATEADAKRKRKGMWKDSGRSDSWETPREFKARTKEGDEQGSR